MIPFPLVSLPYNIFDYMAYVYSQEFTNFDGIIDIDRLRYTLYQELNKYQGLPDWTKSFFGFIGYKKEDNQLRSYYDFGNLVDINNENMFLIGEKVKIKITEKTLNGIDTYLKRIDNDDMKQRLYNAIAEALRKAIPPLTIK